MTGDASQYDEDHYAWCLNQAARLHTLAQSAAYKDKGVDWEHVAEEIEDLGHEQRYHVEASLTRAMIHLVQLAALPDAPFATGWRKEIRRNLDIACDRYQPSMAGHIDMEKLWRKVGLRARRDLQDDEIDLPEIQASCPYTIEALVAIEYDLSELFAVMAGLLRKPASEAQGNGSRSSPE